MNLRQRTLLAIAATSVCLSTGFYYLSRGPLLANYHQIEREEVDRDARRAVSGIDLQVRSLQEKIDDWAQWDDAYRFMADRNQAFVESNLKVVSLPIDSILFVDKSGKIWADRAVVRSDEEAPPASEALRHALKFDRPISERPMQGKGYAGIVEVGGKLLDVAVSPISNSEATAPPRGWLVFARYLGSSEVRQLRQDMNLTVQLFAMSDLRSFPDCREAADHLATSDKNYAIPLNSNVIAGYTYLRDVFGKPVRLVRVIQPRTVYQHGLAMARYFEYLIFAASIIFGIVIVVVVEVSALSRVSRLSEQVDKTGSDGSQRIQLEGKDELARLATKINGMLSRQEESARQIRESEMQLRAYSEGLEQVVAERTRELAAKNAVLANAVEGISRLDEKGNFVSVNLSFAEIAGYDRAEIIGVNWMALIHPSDHNRFRNALHEMRQLGKSVVDVASVKLDGSCSYLEVVLISSPAFLGHYCFAKDITVRKRLEKQIEHQASHDAMTDLPNRLLFMDRLKRAHTQARRRNRSVGVLFLDLDNFKVINDSSGHQAGDQLLRVVAERLTNCLRAEDTVARLGGDEFAILLEDLEGPELATETARCLIDSLNEPVLLTGGEVVISASIGIACANGSEVETEDLLRDADTAMYAAKANGKSSYALFDQSMNARAVERMDLEIGLRQALERDNLHLQYQPLIDLRNGTMSGVEVLARWHCPVRGDVPPSQFIPIAEETGLIVPLGRWVLRGACLQMMAWMATEGDHCPDTISVNLSGKQLQRPDVVDQVAEILAETGLPPERLKLEITESVLMNDVSEGVAKMKRLREMGVKLAIDDFGTGYSSMACLTSFPVDTVKIDRAFVSRIVDEDEAAGIVAAIVMMSKTMRLDVTAEGIEDEDQLRYLVALGCQTGQGFYFSRPVDADEIAKNWLVRKERAA